WTSASRRRATSPPTSTATDARRKRRDRRAAGGPARAREADAAAPAPAGGPRCRGGRARRLRGRRADGDGLAGRRRGAVPADAPLAATARVQRLLVLHAGGGAHGGRDHRPPDPRG